MGLREYTHRTFLGHYDQALHHTLLMETLEEVEAGLIPRLIVTMPPRHGKSEITSVRFPAWYLGRNPDRNIISMSFQQRLANKFSRQVRQQLRHQSWPFTGVQLQHGHQQVDDWGIEGHRGGMIAVSMRGGVTGEGGDLIILDDPMKGTDWADSPARRDFVFNTYVNDIRSRLEKGGAIVLVMTRWHEDDIAGRLLHLQEQGEGEEWEVLHLPAIAMENDALGRNPGEALWERRWPLAELKIIQSALAERVWLANYQGVPSPAEGLLFHPRWFRRRYRRWEDLQIQHVIQAVDSAFEEGAASAFSAIATWAIAHYKGEEVLALLDVWRARVEYPDLINALKDQNGKWSARLGRPVEMHIEKAASGRSARQTLQYETTIPVIAWSPNAKGSKFTRAEASTPPFRAGRCVFPEKSNWLPEFIDEHVKFPTARTNDQVDTTSIAMDVLYRPAEALKTQPAWFPGMSAMVGGSHPASDAAKPTKKYRRKQQS